MLFQYVSHAVFLALHWLPINSSLCSHCNITAVARNSAAPYASHCTTFVVYVYASTHASHVSLISMIPSVVISSGCLCNNTASVTLLLMDNENLVSN